MRYKYVCMYVHINTCTHIYKYMYLIRRYVNQQMGHNKPEHPIIARLDNMNVILFLQKQPKNIKIYFDNISLCQTTLPKCLTLV